MEGMEEFFVAKTGRVFGGNPLLETTKISLAQRWEFRLTFGVPRDSDPKRLEKIPFCQKIGVGILWANIPEMSSLKTAKRCCVIYFHICPPKKKNNKTSGLWRDAKKEGFKQHKLSTFFRCGRQGCVPIGGTFGRTSPECRPKAKGGTNEAHARCMALGAQQL